MTNTRKAASRYRQVRITVTEEARGRVSVRVLAKPLTASWSIRHTVWSHTWSPSRPTTHWSELVAEALYEVTTQRVLPED
jgi:hypothetical protein